MTVEVRAGHALKKHNRRMRRGAERKPLDTFAGGRVTDVPNGRGEALGRIGALMSQNTGGFTIEIPNNNH